MENHREALRDAVVLIIDDESDNAEFMYRVLKHFGAQVTITDDANIALAILQAQRFTVLLCDLSMPNLDGWEFFQKIHHDERFRNLPVIAVTAHALRKDEQRALASGFAAYVVKPITDVPAFLNLIANTANSYKQS